MNHKDRKTINLWLKDLREKEYITWIYSTHFLEKTKPAIYYLGINGVRFLKIVQTEDDSPYYPIEEVRKRYRESSRSQTFIDHSILVADCCINLEAKSNDSSNTLQYSFVTQADYIDPDNYYQFLYESELIRPDLCYVRTEQKKENEVATNYLLEVFDATLPRYRLKHRVKTYVDYLNDGEWEYATEDDEPPVVLLGCARTTDLIYAKRRTKRLLEDIQDEDTDEDERLHIRFTTVEKLKEHGVTGRIWEEA